MIRKISPKQIYHIYNRAVLKIKIFREPRDYLRFISKISELKHSIPVKLIAYCIMPNHFHLILKEPDLKINSRMRYHISIFMNKLQNSYAKHYSVKYKHSGRVFQGTFKNVHIKTNEQLQKTIEYIHMNPVRKKLVRKPTDWPYSSASNPNI